MAFSAEAGGRWSKDAKDFLWRAAGRASERHPGLAELGSKGRAAVFSAWLNQLSCALQKANVACLRSASAGGRPPGQGARAEGTGLAAEDLEAPEGDWLAEVVEQLLQQPAADAAELS